MNFLKPLAPDPDIVTCAYHGLDLSRFPPLPKPHGMRDGQDPDDPIHLLSVGRAVEKKGYDGLLEALATLPAHLHWRFIHIGGGPALDRLQDKADQLGLSRYIEWRGPLPQQEVLEAYRNADLFILNSRITNNGDRDGLPNVLMEAQSQGVPCIASDVSAIPELIIDAETGYLTPPDDTHALADLLHDVIVNPEQRLSVARKGEQRVRTNFALDKAILVLADRFGIPKDCTGVEVG